MLPRNLKDNPWKKQQKACKPKGILSYIFTFPIHCDPITLPILCIRCQLWCHYGEHHRLFGPLSQQRALVNKLNLCNLADGKELQSPGWLVCVVFPVFGAQWKHSYYGQKEWTHRLQWQPACFVIWMMKLMYGPLVCAEQPQSFCQVMNSINTVGYWERLEHTRSHLNSSFPFSLFSIFGTSQINCIVFLSVLSLPSFFPSFHPCPSIYTPLPLRNF